MPIFDISGDKLSAFEQRNITFKVFFVDLLR